MRLTQTLKQKPTVSPQLVLANKLLQFSWLELEQAIAHELAQNPALELYEVERCLTCGAGLVGGKCPTCGLPEARRDEVGRDKGDPFDGDAGTYSGNASGGEWNDPISRLPSRTTFTEYLLRQARLSLSVADIAIARHVIGSLDDRGFFSCDVADVASYLDVAPERVNEVLTVVQSLEPPGVAARNVCECLLIQIADLESKSCSCLNHVERSVAERLIRDQWDRLGRSALDSLAEQVDASVDEVRGALRFIRENLNPFPAHAYWADVRRALSRDETSCPEPDVIIRESKTAKIGYDIELPKAGTYRLRVSASYRRAMDDLGSDRASPDSAGWRRWEELRGRARLFVKSIEQRWETLHDLMCCLIEYQRDFLIHGEQCLKPLTRARVAEMMGVHESTVSRAVAGKYVELPRRRVVSLDTFFDGTAAVKHLIEEFIAQEEVALSDRVIAERLAEQGFDVSRRTVAKYRNALNILPSSLRERDKELGT